MTPLRKPITRSTAVELDGHFGTDRGKRLVVTLIPGRPGAPDMIELRPLGTRRAERIAVMDVYQYALRSRVSRDLLAKARAVKARRAEAREKRRLDAQTRRLARAAMK
ncbi:MAG: hypothetical protein IT581_12260, partial [Verrucomicrobiales bacterium]|nr:hypothetical protein [Verrucomicrobiales bacterium]